MFQTISLKQPCQAPAGVPVRTDSSHFASQHILFKKKKFFICRSLIYNAVLASGVGQSDSVTHVHIFTLFYILFPYRSSKNIERVPCAIQEAPIIYFINGGMSI